MEVKLVLMHLMFMLTDTSLSHRLQSNGQPVVFEMKQISDSMDECGQSEAIILPFKTTLLNNIRSIWRTKVNLSLCAAYSLCVMPVASRAARSLIFWEGHCQI